MAILSGMSKDKKASAELTISSFIGKTILKSCENRQAHEVLLKFMLYQAMVFICKRAVELLDQKPDPRKSLTANQLMFAQMKGSTPKITI